MLPEVARIRSLPRMGADRPPPDSAGDLLLPGTDRTLRKGQLSALGEAQRAGGLLGVIGVGQGKFLISVLAPTVLNAERPLLLVPPDLVKQTKAELLAWKEHVRIHPGLRVMSYNDLSTKNGEATLRDINPDLIVADEAHRLKIRESARTRRFIRWFQEHPNTRLVALSGTMSSRSILDYDHLAEIALREASPLPRSYVEVEAWAANIDAKADPPTDHQQAAFQPLRDAFPAPTAQASYYERLRSCPGVICTVDTSAAECSIRVEARRYAPPPGLKDALKALRKTWSLPDGTELLRASEFAAAVRQLQSGFYYAWDWGPSGPDQAWLGARAGWARVVRDTLSRNTPGVDSPAQVEERVRALGPTHPHWDVLMAWEAEAARLPHPPQRAHWVSYAPVDHALARVEALEAERGPVLVWCDSIALLEACRDSGLRALTPGAPIPTKPTTLALPRHSFGVGRNLQAWSTNLVLEPTSSGAVWEQLIGRTHREGQEADDVLVEVPFWDGIALSYLQGAREDAAYVEQTTGQKQKLLLASHTLEKEAPT